MRVYKRAKNIGASHRKRPLLEVKQTSRFDGAMSARLQQKIIDAVTPFTVKTGTPRSVHEHRKWPRHPKGLD